MKEYLKKHYCIVCKTHKISYTNFLYGNKRCKSCENKRRFLETNFNRGKHCYFYKDGHTLKINTCMDCKKEITWNSKRCYSCEMKRKHKLGIIDNTGKKFPLHSKRMSGKNNHFYIDGKGKEPYTLEFSNNLKESIRKRDNHQCQICNKFGKDVHHIDYNKCNCKKQNLINLCHKHHTKTNFERDYWYAYFIYIMEN